MSQVTKKRPVCLERTSGSGYRLSLVGRLFLVICGLGLLSGFLLAASLEPDPRGFGTHQRLGLPPCSFRIWFGIHCPSCGSTTSFSHFIRGEWLSALQSNLAAFGLALVCAAAVPWTFYSAWQGRTWGLNRPALALACVTGVLCVISLTQWTVRVLLPALADSG